MCLYCEVYSLGVVTARLQSYKDDRVGYLFLHGPTWWDTTFGEISRVPPTLPIKPRRILPRSQYATSASTTD